MASPLKILVCGDVEGNFNQLYKRVTGINRKAGPFDMLFCIGNFFGDTNSEWDAYVSGESKVPVSTLVLGPNKQAHAKFFPDEDGGELAPNITYLGRRGIYTSSSGLQVAYLSGLDGGRDKETNFSGDDVDALRLPLVSDSKFRGVDILITSVWPAGVEKYAAAVDGKAFDSRDGGSRSICQLALSLKPRYHFAALEGAFYERQPYRNHQVLAEPPRHVTRFVGLANVGNSSKKKYLYAFNITPLKAMDVGELTKQPADVTECPFSLDSSVVTSQVSQSEKSAQYFYDPDAVDGRRGRGRGGHDRKRQYHDGGPQDKRKPQQPAGPCWFCLGSPSVEKHLVVSVGTHTYMALAKGGLTPDHVMILPIGHHQSTVAAPPEVTKEINKYKTVLGKYFKTEGKVPVYFERNYKTSHLQIQVVPVDKQVVRELKETFEGCAQSHGFELHEIPKHSDLGQIVPGGVPYFYAELPSGEKMLHRIKSNFPLQFGREVLAHDTLLDLPHRVDWRNCKTSQEDEEESATTFRKSFAPFEFNAL